MLKIAIKREGGLKIEERPIVIPAKSDWDGREPGSRKESDYIALFLVSGSRSAKRSSSGMTRLGNCDFPNSEKLLAELS
jgi:hypothetical protein